jgi:glucose-1-phosphate thymidylyltransferase
MKGIILAGGTGSRLAPLTEVTNKHLLPVGRYPMVYWPLNTLLECGVRDIMVVTGVEHLDALIRTLGSGRSFGAEFTYRVQDQAGGIAEALGLCHDFAAGQSVMVVLGDNVFAGDLSPYLDGFESGAQLFLCPHKRPNRFGVARVEGDRIIEIIEKPEHPPSDLVVTGCYIYDNHVFELVPDLERSARGELEITDVNNAYVRAGTLRHAVLPFGWTDAGTFDSLAEANELTAGRIMSFDTAGRS